MLQPDRLRARCEKPVDSVWLVLAAITCLAAWNSATASLEAALPNIVVIYADDLGYGDVQCYNPERGKIPTPHIDSIAAAGMRFTDAHSSSGVCSPSRYTLLTGRYHWRTRLQSGIVGLWEEPLIAAGRLTIGGLAQQHGYRTSCIGKWHLGWNWPASPEQRRALKKLATDRENQQRLSPDTVTDEQRALWQTIFSQPIPGGPTAVGFDAYFGTDVPNWPPFSFIENDRLLDIPTTLLSLSDFQNNRASNQGPAVEGWSLEAVLPRLRDEAVRFISESSKAPEPFLLYLPLTSPHTPLAVNEPWQRKSGLDNACADLIMETDAVVGDVLTAVEQAGITDSTLVVFTSDNGFAPYVGAADLEARGHFPSGPLRGYKSDAWEGGHRVAFIVRYPPLVTAGTTCDQLVHQADLLATFADLFDHPLPADAGEDSVSLLPLLKGGDEPVRQHAISCGANGLPTLRDRNWKLVLGPGSGGWSKGGNEAGLQLYNLEADLGEKTNLASEMPNRVNSMLATYQRLVAEGRSTPGRQQANDVNVREYPKQP
jgi:arylsulfatase A